MLISRIRAALLGLLAMMLVGSAMAATASAELAPGPFWHHRPVGGKGAGEKIEPKAPENFRGEGSEQKLAGEIASLAVEINSKATQVKGAIFNGPIQGQIKLGIVYVQPELKKPELKGCAVKVGENNTVQVKGYVSWKWDGTANQLTAANQEAAGQRADFIFSAVEPGEKEELKEGTFTTVTLSGSGCGALAGTVNVSGSDIGIPNHEIEEWNKELSVRTLPPQENLFRQHQWNGRLQRFWGHTIPLSLGSKPASLTGQTTVNSEQQEVAIFEN